MFLQEGNEKMKKEENSDSSSDDDDEELHPLLQAHRRPVTKSQPPPKKTIKETSPALTPTTPVIDQKRPAANPQDVAKKYLSMKYKSNPEPELIPPPSQQQEHQPKGPLPPTQFNNLQHQQQNYPFGGFPSMQHQPPPPPPGVVFPQHHMQYHQNNMDHLIRPHGPPRPFGTGFGIDHHHHQLPIGDNFRVHPQAHQQIDGRMPMFRHPINGSTRGIFLNLS